MRTSSRIAGLTLIVASCLVPPIFADKVQTQTGENVDFSRYQTYQWFPPRVLTKVGVVEDHPANSALKEVIGRELSNRGMSEVASGGDLMIQAYVLTESVPQLEAVLLALGMENPKWGTAQVATMGRYNRQGTLCINLIDPRTKKSVWIAMATGSLPSRTLTPAEIRAKFGKAATKMFAKFPVRKK